MKNDTRLGTLRAYETFNEGKSLVDLVNEFFRHGEKGNAIGAFIFLSENFGKLKGAGVVAECREDLEIDIWLKKSTSERLIALQRNFANADTFNLHRKMQAMASALQQSRLLFTKGTLTATIPVTQAVQRVEIANPEAIQTTVNAFPARSVQAVERDSKDEIVRTVTTYEPA